MDDNDEEVREVQEVLAISARRSQLKGVKTCLEGAGCFGKHIVRLNNNPAIPPSPTTTTTATNGDEDRYILHTTLSPDASSLLPPLPEGTRIVSVPALEVPAGPTSPLTAAIASYLAAHPPESGAGDIKTLLSTAPRRSTTYPPMLQLPADAFTSAPWSAYISAHPSFLPHLAHSLNVSHIVRLAPIAAASTIRAPGPGLTILHPENNDTTLWASATQHGIHQVWAPQHTMFSRGNITEKARVRALPRIAGKTVVDLYAGIGYFVFSHVAAGARRVYAWEINPWSVEGLVRGAARNGWRTRVVREDEAWTWGDDEAGVGAGGVGDGEGDGGVRIVVFQESNTHAVAKRGLPRGCAAHVNLGLLPSSRQGWETAAHLVDRKGGALHVHENVADTGEGIGEMRGVVVAEMRALVKAGDAGEEGGTGKGEGKVELEGVEVRCTHVQRVKTFAPGVVHAVFDIEVGAPP